MQKETDVENPRVRFAPSPTGHLHVGGARTALFNWLFARGNQGEFILRIEDTDRSRSTEESVQGIKDSLHWLGLDWDEYYRQTKRKDLHQKKATELLEEEKAYKSEGALWFKVPQSGQVKVEDVIMGDVVYECEELKDFVIRRSDGTFTYNFACVVDDVEMEISHVMRGDDHLNNTPKQILIYRALGVHLPRFAHFPMILGEDQTRLSKRHGATSVLSFRRRGFLPEALMNFLARLGWSHGDQEIFDKEELIDLFSLEQVGSAPAIFDEEKLTWLNHSWLKRREPGELVPQFKEFLKEELDLSEGEMERLDEKRLEKACQLSRERNKTLRDMVQASRFIFQTDLDYDKELVQKHLDGEKSSLLADLGEKLGELEEEGFEPGRLEEETRAFLAERGSGLGQIAQACRLALTGREVSPGLFQTMAVLGKEKTVRRLEAMAGKVKF